MTITQFICDTVVYVKLYFNVLYEYILTIVDDYTLRMLTRIVIISVMVMLKAIAVKCSFPHPEKRSWLQNYVIELQRTSDIGNMCAAMASLSITVPE